MKKKYNMKFLLELKRYSWLFPWGVDGDIGYGQKQDLVAYDYTDDHPSHFEGCKENDVEPYMEDYLECYVEEDVDDNLYDVFDYTYEYTW